MHATHRLRLPAVLVLLVALATLPLGSPPPAAAATDRVANCPLKVRASPSTSATILATLPTGAGVTVAATVTGSAWSATCVTAVSGSTWYAITAVNGQSVSTLYGVTVAYAATGLFRAASYLEGIDVSTWQGTVDFAKVKAAGKSFVIGKATEGIGYVDPKYATNRSAARSAGLAFTGYHYARPDLNPTNPVGEADWFVSKLALASGMLVPALDVEVAGTLGTAALQKWVAAWLAEVYARTGVRAMIYTNPSFWKSAMGDTTSFAGQGYTVLWIAHWFVSAPTVPAANWGGRGWTFWQYEDCGAVPGIVGCVDLDRYNGTDLTRVTFGADFALAVTPTSRSVKQGVKAGYTITVSRTFFTLPVALAVSGLPPGTSATLSSATVTGSSAAMTVSTSNSGTVTPVGTYPLKISGTSNGRTHTTSATLVVTDGIGPTVSAPTSRLFGLVTLGSSTMPVRTSWSASDPSGIASYALHGQVDGSWSPVSLTSAASTSVVQSLPFGSTYRYAAKATDGKANTSGWAYGSSFRPYLLQESGTGLAYSGTWSGVADAAASGGGLKYATANGASAGYAFNGSSVAWVSYRGPTRGSADVYVDGVKKATVNLYAAANSARQIVFAANWTWNGSHTIKIVCLGTAGHARVDVDAFVRLTLT